MYTWNAKNHRLYSRKWIIVAWLCKSDGQINQGTNWQQSVQIQQENLRIVTSMSWWYLNLYANFVSDSVPDKLIMICQIVFYNSEHFVSCIWSNCFHQNLPDFCHSCIFCFKKFAGFNVCAFLWRCHDSCCKDIEKSY